MKTHHQPIDWPATFGAVADIAQTTAFVCAGAWTYGLFIKQRIDRKRADVSLSASVAARDDDQLLLRVQFDIRNVGHVELSPDHAIVKVNAVKYRGKAISLPTDSDGAPYNCDTVVGMWPELAICRIQLGADKLVLEPGESERYPLDVMISSTIEVVQVSAVLRSNDNPKGEYWDEFVIVDLRTAVGSTRTE